MYWDWNRIVSVQLGANFHRLSRRTIKAADYHPTFETKLKFDSRFLFWRGEKPENEHLNPFLYPPLLQSESYLLEREAYMDWIGGIILRSVYTVTHTHRFPFPFSRQPHAEVTVVVYLAKVSQEIRRKFMGREITNKPSSSYFVHVGFCKIIIFVIWDTQCRRKWINTSHHISHFTNSCPYSTGRTEESRLNKSVLITASAPDATTPPSPNIWRHKERGEAKKIDGSFIGGNVMTTHRWCNFSSLFRSIWVKQKGFENTAWRCRVAKCTYLFQLRKMYFYIFFTCRMLGGEEYCIHESCWHSELRGQCAKADIPKAFPLCRIYSNAAKCSLIHPAHFFCQITRLASILFFSAFF